MTIRIAIAGAGYIANIHARAAQKQKNVKLTAVVDKYPGAAKRFAEQFSIENCYSSIEKLLQAGRVDALIIGTPNFLHAPQAIAALKHGLHVLVEKPMAMNAGEAARMLKTSNKSRSVLMVAHCWRFDQDVLWLKKMSSRLGRIIRTKGYGVHVRWGPGGWFTQKELAGGGALADMGIHALDTARFLLGDPQPVSVYARISTRYKDFDVDDTCVMLVNWEGDVSSYVESGWWQPHADGPEAATQLYGTKGFGQLFPTRLEIFNRKTSGLELIESGSKFPRKEHCPQGMYDAQMAAFIKCINTGKTPNPGGEEGMVNMKVIDAAYKSARTGRVVGIKP